MRRKYMIEVLAVAMLLALAISFMTVFNSAVVGGGETIVSVDHYGEMVAELIILHFVVWPVITVGLYYWHSA